MRHLFVLVPLYLAVVGALIVTQMWPEGDMDDPEQHPIAIALRRECGIDDARVSKREMLIQRDDHWFRYGAPKRVS